MYPKDLTSHDSCQNLLYFYCKDPEVSQVASAKVASSHKGHSKEQRNDKD